MRSFTPRLISPHLLESYDKYCYDIWEDLLFELPMHQGGDEMGNSVYKVIELVGASTESWEKAAEAAISMASQSLRDLRIAEVVELDMQIDDGKVVAYRAKLKLSFKFQTDE